MMSDGFIAHFTAATISAYDEYSPWAELSGIVIPGQASELDVTWGDVILVLTLIPAFQAVLGLICICVVYYFKVHVHDDSPLEMAKLLAPTISRGPNDNLHCDEEVAKTIDKSLEANESGRCQVGAVSVER